MNFFVTKIVEDSDVTYNLTVAGYVALAGAGDAGRICGRLYVSGRK